MKNYNNEINLCHSQNQKQHTTPHFHIHTHILMNTNSTNHHRSPHHHKNDFINQKQKICHQNTNHPNAKITTNLLNDNDNENSFGHPNGIANTTFRKLRTVLVHTIRNPNMCSLPVIPSPLYIFACLRALALYRRLQHK